MRGFPVLSTLVAIALLALAWWPLSYVTGKSSQTGAESGTDCPLTPLPTAAETGVSSPVPVFLTVRASHAPSKLTLVLDGENEIDLAEGADWTGEITKELSIVIPTEGIEAWVEAQWPEDVANVALAISLTPEAGEERRVTLWSDGPELSDLAEFIW